MRKDVSIIVTGSGSDRELRRSNKQIHLEKKSDSENAGFILETLEGAQRSALRGIRRHILILTQPGWQSKLTKQTFTFALASPIEVGEITLLPSCSLYESPKI